MSSPSLVVPFFSIFFIIILAFGFLINFGLAYLIYRDAKSKNVDNPILWFVVVFFFTIPGIIIYLILGSNNQNRYSTNYANTYASNTSGASYSNSMNKASYPQSQKGQTQTNYCKNCGSKVAYEDQFCNSCGSKIDN